MKSYLNLSLAIDIFIPTFVTSKTEKAQDTTLENAVMKGLVGLEGQDDFEIFLSRVIIGPYEANCRWSLHLKMHPVPEPVYDSHRKDR